MRLQKRSPKAAKFSVPKSGTAFPESNIHRCYLSTNHRNRTAECIVYPSGIGEQRENNDAPETDFDRRFPHEPLQEQTKEAAGQALPRAGQAFLRIDPRPGTPICDPTMPPPLGWSIWPLI